jgi:hypothetical protein
MKGPPADIEDIRGSSACAGKERFANPAIARRVARLGNQRREGNRHAYRCPRCGGWHIGSAIAKAALRDPYRRRKSEIHERELTEAEP